jgi:hypothetical protein
VDVGRDIGRGSRAVGVAALLTLTGCYGSFRLTETVASFNQRISDSAAVRELVFVAFVIVPVYEVSLVADALVLNVVEFARGDNLLPSRRVAALPDGRTVTAIPDPGGDGVWIEVTGERARRLIRRGRTIAVLEDGAPVATVTAADDGSLVLTGRAGLTGHAGATPVSAAEVERLVEAVANGAGSDAIVGEVSRILQVETSSRPRQQ